MSSRKKIAAVSQADHDDEAETIRRSSRARILAQIDEREHRMQLARAIGNWKAEAYHRTVRDGLCEVYNDLAQTVLPLGPTDNQGIDSTPVLLNPVNKTNNAASHARPHTYELKVGE